MLRELWEQPLRRVPLHSPLGQQFSTINHVAEVKFENISPNDNATLIWKLKAGYFDAHLTQKFSSSSLF